MINDNDFQSIIQENIYSQKRQQLLGLLEEKLSERFKEKVGIAAYIANTLDPGIAAITMMNITHLIHLDDLIRVACKDNADSLALIIESFGGEATFPEEVANRARTHCKKFYTIIVNLAKSAATLLSMFSDKIIALDTASFGPVDPQLVIHTPQLVQPVSARQIREMIEQTIPNITKNLNPAERAAVYASQNYLLYQQAIDSIKLVKDYLHKELKNKFSEEQIRNIEKDLVDVPLSHSISISIDQLNKLGFDTLKINSNEELGRLLIEYHRRALRNLLMETPNGRGLILFESKKRSFSIVAPVTSSPVASHQPQPQKT